MFVRWKRWSRQEGVMRAVLVKSVRTPQGVRQRILCYLGSVATWRHGQWGQEVFWSHAGPKLDGLDIPAEEKARITAELERVVPRPPPPDEEALRAQEERTRQWKAAHGIR
jgi:hypothetical protein